VIAAVAEFERDLLIERTNAGLSRAKKNGKRFGRPPALDEGDRKTALALLGAGVPVAEVARDLNTSRQTILRARKAAEAAEAKEAAAA
jgi:putative DNA-invertase from lambdoid prophage Rac